MKANKIYTRRCKRCEELFKTPHKGGSICSCCSLRKPHKVYLTAFKRGLSDEK